MGVIPTAPVAAIQPMRPVAAIPAHPIVSAPVAPAYPPGRSIDAEWLNNMEAPVAEYDAATQRAMQQSIDREKRRVNTYCYMVRFSSCGHAKLTHQKTII